MSTVSGRRGDGCWTDYIGKGRFVTLGGVLGGYCWNNCSSYDKGLVAKVVSTQHMQGSLLSWKISKIQTI